MSIDFHHKPGQKNPTKKGIDRLSREDLKHKKNGYGTYTVEQIISENTKTHKKDKERPRC
jgi:hypothetical protein